MTTTGSATLIVKSLSAGSNSLTCAYSGDGNYNQSTSPVLSQTVHKATPTVTLASGAAPSVFGQAVPLTAGTGGLPADILPPTGSFSFYQGATLLGTAPVVPLQLTPVSSSTNSILTIPNFSVGTHSPLSATFSGDDNYNSATTSSISQTVNQASTSVALSASANPSALCQSVTFSARVSAVSPGSGTPTGNVVFLQNGSPMATITLSSGVAAWSTSSLSAGSPAIAANYQGDSNFSTNAASLTQTVNAAVNWLLTAAPAAPDPKQGVLVPVGSASVSPLSGALMRGVPIDGNQHDVCKCGCCDRCQAGLAPLALLYNSSTVNVKPVIQVSLASDFCAAVPSQIQAQLTWNGTPQGTMTYATTGHSSGDIYSLPLQVSSAVSASGIYPWSVAVAATVGTMVYNRTASGVLPVVVNSSSPFGAGCSLAGTQSLLVGSAGVAMVDNSTGGFRYFVGTGPSYTSPANDQGTLVQNMDGSYTYTSKDQIKTNFDSTGRMTSQVDPHGLAQSLAYFSPLKTITQPDGGVVTFSYNVSNLLAWVEQPGGFFLTFSYDGSNNLIGLVDAAGGIYTFAYDGSNRLINEQVGPLNTTYGYASDGTLNTINRGLGSVTTITAEATQGLSASTAINASQSVATVTDPLNHTTTYLLDSLGRTLQLQTADGALQTWTLDAAGNPTVSIDQIGRVTSMVYNGSEDLTQIAWPDGTFTTYQYDATFHQITQVEDALGHYLTNTYDGTTGDLLTEKDGLGHVTSHTWSSGLEQTKTDPLGRVTTHTWDSTTRRLLSETDPLGNVTSYAYDAPGNQISVEDALGHITTTSYDGDRRLLTSSNALGGVRTMSYDAIGDVLTSSDELNRTTSNSYDQRGWLTSSMEAVGTAQQRTTSTTHDVAGNLSYVTNALAEITSFSYDALNRQVAQIEAFGSGVQRTTTSLYDAVGNVISAIDALGTTTSFGFDVRNRQIQQIDAFGNALQRTTSTNYDAVGNVLFTTNPRGTITSFGYDANNRQTKLIEGSGTSLARTTTSLYDNVGNTLSVTNPVAAITSFGYDSDDRQTLLIEAYGSAVQRTTTTLYNAVGNVLSMTNPRGFVVSYAYDALDRVVQQFDAFGNALQRTLTSVYDAVSNLLSVTNGLAVVTSFAYDNLNRAVARLDAFGTALQRTTTTVYDSDDNVIASVDPLAFSTTFGYDALNRRITVEAPDSGVATTVYDGNSNVVNTIDQLGHTTTNSYDILNRKTQTTDARGGIVTLVYDANNNLLSLTDPVNNLTAWLYDLLDRSVRETDPLGNVATVAYDAADRQTSATDRLGQVIDFSYDLLNRETGESWFNAGGTQVNALTFTHDANDTLLTAVNNTSANTMGYDALDRLATVQVPFAAVLTNSYDAADNRTLVQDSQGGTTTQVFDALNRMTTMLFSGNSATLREDFGYTARDQVATQTRFSNLAGTSTIGSSAFSYDSVGRLTNLVHQNGTGTTLANMTNTYDLASRITSETLNGAAPTSYAYDTIDELTSDGVNSYSYDLNGNRTMAGYATGPANEMTSDGTWDYFCDKNGNVVAKVNISTGEAFAFGYDNRNRLISALDVTTGLQMQATYLYDAVGKRIEKDVWTQTSGSTTTTRFAYDGDEIWADLTSANALQMRYLRGILVLELPARVSSGGTAAWMLVDRMGSVRNVVDNTGAVIDTITYNGYGNITAETNATNSNSRSRAKPLEKERRGGNRSQAI